jgi:hypothetical protein
LLVFSQCVRAVRPVPARRKELSLQSAVPDCDVHEAIGTAATQQSVVARARRSLPVRANRIMNDLLLERIPIGWNYPIDKNTLKINRLEHVLIGKVSQLFRNML